MEDTIKEIFNNEFGIDNVKTSDNLIEDLCIDSLDVAELAAILERRFNISISDDDLRSFVTVQDVIDYVEKYK